MNHKRQLLAQLGLIAAAVCLPGAASAQPDAPVPAVMKIVVPFGPGASNDAIARAVAPVLAKRLGNTVIVENKAGAAGTIGADFVAKGPRDGSALLLTSSTFVTAAATQAKMPYDPLTAFAPVAMVGSGPMLVAVSAATPIKTAADLVAAARARPGKLTYGTSGVGSIAHLSSEMISDAARVLVPLDLDGIRNASHPVQFCSGTDIDDFGARRQLQQLVGFLRCQFALIGAAKPFTTGTGQIQYLG